MGGGEKRERFIEPEDFCYTIATDRPWNMCTDIVRCFSPISKVVSVMGNVRCIESVDVVSIDRGVSINKDGTDG